MIMPSVIVSTLVRKVPTVACVRTLASGSPSDPIQKLFLDKLKDYNQKAASTADGLVDATDATKKALAEEFQRVKRNHGINDGEEAKITTTFSDASFKIDSIKQSDWK
ncbi:hypothetical protein HDE_12021 [Halotydeus destructor]|nr:hypothetical protein HDE_12021 [Halotydeus destructor]